jgi:hypothetical protein
MLEDTMKCYVHLGYDPVPKQADSPTSAIASAESHLSFIAESDDDDPSSKWLIRHRVDELYPDNFVEYTHDDLLTGLQKNGTVVLQLVRYGEDNVPVMGEMCNIFTSEYEKKQDEEANIALEMTEESLTHKQIDLHGEAMIPMRRRLPAKKV